LFSATNTPITIHWYSTTLKSKMEFRGLMECVTLCMVLSAMTFYNCNAANSYNAAYPPHGTPSPSPTPYHNAPSPSPTPYHHAPTPSPTLYNHAPTPSPFSYNHVPTPPPTPYNHAPVPLKNPKEHHEHLKHHHKPSEHY
jgi:hypothetical protein